MVFIELVHGKLLEFEPVSDWLHDGNVSSSERSARIFSAMEPPQRKWLEMIQLTKVPIDEYFVGFLLEHGSESHLACALEFLGYGFKIDRADILLDSLSRCPFGNDHESLQKLFVRLLTDSDDCPDKYMCKSLFDVILPRAIFVKILIDLKPNYIQVMAKTLQTFTFVQESFLHGVIKGFEGPDLFLEYAQMELGPYILPSGIANNMRTRTNAAMRYVIHRKQVNAFKFGDRSILDVAMNNSWESNEPEPFECIEELLMADADVSTSSKSGECSLQCILKYPASASRFRILVLLIRNGADISNVDEEHHGIIRHALCQLGIKYLIEAMRDENSTIYMGGFDIAEVIYKSVLGSS
jgi:hypothetical protein